MGLWEGKLYFFGGIVLAKNNNSLSSSIKTILSLKPDEESEEKLIAKGVPKNKINNGTAIMQALVEKAVTGEVSAIKEVLSILEKDNQEQKSNISKLYKALSDED